MHDKKIDCYSGFDEGCPAHYFVCRDRSACIEPSKYLNGVADCKDKSDEREWWYSRLIVYGKGKQCIHYEIIVAICLRKGNNNYLVWKTEK